MLSYELVVIPASPCWLLDRRAASTLLLSKNAEPHAHLLSARCATAVLNIRHQDNEHEHRLTDTL